MGRYQENRSRQTILTASEARSLPAAQAEPFTYASLGPAEVQNRHAYCCATVLPLGNFTQQQGAQLFFAYSRCRTAHPSQDTNSPHSSPNSAGSTIRKIRTTTWFRASFEVVSNHKYEYDAAKPQQPPRTKASLLFLANHPISSAMIPHGIVTRAVPCAKNLALVKAIASAASTTARALRLSTADILKDNRGERFVNALHATTVSYYDILSSDICLAASPHCASTLPATLNTHASGE